MSFDEQGLASAQSEADRNEMASRYAAARALRNDQDIRNLLGSESGRRILRELIADGFLDLDTDAVPDLFHHDHAYMADMQAKRLKALEYVWPILRMVAARQLDSEALSLLFNTSEDEL